jgi:hypothetical protein
MKAISISQPMAWAVFHGKDVENRKKAANVRGRVMIHASKTFNMQHYNWLVNNRLCKDIPSPDSPAFIRGAVIGEVDIVDCVKEYSSPWKLSGLYGFILSNPSEYEKSLPCKGKVAPLFFEPDFHHQ